MEAPAVASIIVGHLIWFGWIVIVVSLVVATVGGQVYAGCSGVIAGAFLLWAAEMATQARQAEQNTRQSCELLRQLLEEIRGKGQP